MSELARRWWHGELGIAGSALSVLTAPAEAAYRVATSLRNRAYDRGILATLGAEIPVISIGNIAVGGSGKTPFTSWLAQRIALRGERPAIVHGGYAADEPELHRAWTPEIPVIVDRDRVRAARAARQAGATVVLLDDAFQHRRLHRDLDLVLVSVERWSDAVRLLPRGPWREPASALQRADIIACVRRTAAEPESRALATALSRISDADTVRVHLRATTWLRRGASAAAPREPVLVVAGVADPDLFVGNVRDAGAAVRETMMYPDHHVYTAADAARIRAAAAGRPVVTSAKDWVKLRALLDADGVWVLTQEVVLEESASVLDAALDRVLR